MSFEFNPESQQAQPEVAPPQERVSFWFIACGLALVVLLGVCMVWMEPVDKVKGVLGRRCARQARAALEAQNWSLAVEQLVAARRWAPDDVEVMRVAIEFTKTSGTDPNGLAQQLRALAEKEPLTEDEQILLGRTLASAGKTDDARQVYAALPLRASTEKPALQLLSSILRQEGHGEEARELERRATRQVPEEPASRMKMSLEDAKSMFPEIRRRAHDELLQIAREETGIALEAVTHLTVDPLLTAAEARELLSIVDNHPQQKLPVRLGVISALMRITPDQREALLDEAIKHFRSDDAGSLEHLARWLALEKQHARLRRMVPAKLAAKSRDLYPILAQALAEEERWQELRTMLTSARPPVSQARVAVWLAEASSHLEPDLKEAARLLEGSISAAGKEGDLSTLLTAARVAEKLNLTETALLAYRAASAHSTEAVLPMVLQKAHEMALSGKNSTVLLEIAQKLHEIRPASGAYADRLAYLRLVLGVDMETVNVTPPKDGASLQAVFTVVVERVPPSLLQALAAYRLGDPEAVKTHLASLPDASSLPAGQRAVAAGLLALAGKPDRAFQIAEKVPDALLLTEELAFLNHAR